MYRRGGEARLCGDSAAGKMRRERASMLLATFLMPMARGFVCGPCCDAGRLLASEGWLCCLEGASRGSCGPTWCSADFAMLRPGVWEQAPIWVGGQSHPAFPS